MRWREDDGVRWLEARLDGGNGVVATAAFAARTGGASAEPFASLNVGLLTGDEPDRVRENRRRLTEALRRDPDGILFGHQVHEATVHTRPRAPEPNPWLTETPPEQGDGQATAERSLTPLVQVADCLPVALVGPGGVAMLHCGWRGLAAGIVARGAAAVAATSAAIGPGIGPCCYEVGAEVVAEFDHLGTGIAAEGRLDLAEVGRRLLTEAGVESVESSGLCTSCQPELFFSHRRDGARSGRQAGLVWIDDG
jgi:hypothetical protein